MTAHLVKPFPMYELPRVWLWVQQFRRQISDDFSPKTLDEFVDVEMERMARQMTWGVYRDDELGGLIVFEPSSPVAGTSHVTFRRSFWKPRTSVPAMREAYAEIFAAGYRKILSFVFADNNAIRSLAREIGLREEGVLRGQTLRNGRPVDMVALGLLREEFEHANNHLVFNADAGVVSGIPVAQ
ncbi:MAG: GNAT family protein [Planctomycetota bacterium]